MVSILRLKRHHSLKFTSFSYKRASDSLNFRDEKIVYDINWIRSEVKIELHLQVKSIA